MDCCIVSKKMVKPKHNFVNNTNLGQFVFPVSNISAAQNLHCIWKLEPITNKLLI